MSKRYFRVEANTMPSGEECNLVEIKTEPDNFEADIDPLSLNASITAIKEEPLDNCDKPTEANKFYGRTTIELNSDGKINYQFHCDACQALFNSLDSFGEHIKLQHWKVEHKKVADVVETKTITTTTTLRETNEEVENNDSDFHCTDTEDPSYEPKTKKLKSSTRKPKILYFDYPHINCVTTFLELLKTHAILWLKRQSREKGFVDAENSLLKAFNAQFPDYDMTRQELVKSIYRLKTQRISLAKKTKDKSTPKTKMYEDFLKLCTEIDERSEELIKKCDNCKAVFYSSEELQTHKYKIHKIGNLPYTCEICGYGFTDPTTYASHIEKHNRIKNIHCEICGLSFHHESNYKNHMTVHDTGKTFVCETCGKVFSNAKNLKTHKKIHEPRNHVCTICKKAYIEKWQLRDHMKVHQNEKHYVCKLCGKSFNRQKNLYIHSRGAHKNLNKSLQIQEEKDDEYAITSNEETNAYDESTTNNENYQTSFLQLWNPFNE